MVQAHKGYFRENGQFTPESLMAKIPINRQVIVIWDDGATENKELATAQREAAQNFLTAVQKIRSELTEDDKAEIDELESGKYKPIFEDRSAEL